MVGLPADGKCRKRTVANACKGSPDVPRFRDGVGSKPVTPPIGNEIDNLGSSAGHASIDFTAYSYLPDRDSMAEAGDHTAPTCHGAYLNPLTPAPLHCPAGCRSSSPLAIHGRLWTWSRNDS
jgi:hypothetical protein